VKILNISHGHPSLRRGGAEVASHHLHEEFARRSSLESIYLAALRSSAQASHAHTPFASYDSARAELLFLQEPGAFNHFLLTPDRPTQLLSHFADFLSALRPDVVHFHHFVGIGTSALRVVRNVLPSAPVLLTLYEYLPICANDGQFVKTGSLELCYEATPRACHACFPGIPPQDFFLREGFLKQRYVEWGLDESRIIVVDNGFPRVEPLPPRPVRDGEGRGCFAYFGQLNPYKGVQVLLRAFSLLPESAPPWITLDVFGANLEHSPEGFQREFQDLLRGNPRVRFRGPYENSRMRRLLSAIDWVVVPSLWWENSPLVIQEASTSGRPVITSNIGGMAEKVEHGSNGLTFEVGDPKALRDVILEAATREGLWDSLASRLTGGPWIDEIADRLIAEYSALLTR
jgi:glycosyltransferase involved in cell wall biosynthesis